MSIPELVTVFRVLNALTGQTWVTGPLQGRSRNGVSPSQLLSKRFRGWFPLGTERGRSQWEGERTPEKADTGHALGGVNWVRLALRLVQALEADAQVRSARGNEELIQFNLFALS